jgi:hypothetical protein
MCISLRPIFLSLLSSARWWNQRIKGGKKENLQISKDQLQRRTCYLLVHLSHHVIAGCISEHTHAGIYFDNTVREEDRAKQVLTFVITFACNISKYGDTERWILCVVHLPTISTVGIWQTQVEGSMTESTFSYVWHWLHCSCLTDLVTGT